MNVPQSAGTVGLLMVEWKVRIVSIFIKARELAAHSVQRYGAGI